MTPPLCIGCQERPVKKQQCGRQSKLHGKRVVDGRHWHWYCSLSCATRAMGRRNYQTGTFRIAALASRKQRIRREIARLKAYIAPHITADGMVPAKLFVRAAMQEKHRVYQAGYSAGQYNGRRQAIA